LASGTRRRTAKRAVQVSAPVADALDPVDQFDEDEPAETNYALRLTEALEAISAAQNTPEPSEPIDVFTRIR